MGIASKISWTQSTWNPFMGCKKVSDGCKFCYMYRDKERYGQEPTKVIKSKTNFTAPLRWKEPKLIFVCSWSDFFIEEADEWRDELWKLIKDTPQHTYQILTKRPERIEKCLPADWGTGYSNVWLGVSAENQKEFLRRSQILCETHAKVRFISAEPLLEAIEMENLFKSYYLGIHWVIVGGESGNENGKYTYRPCDIDWIEKIINDCKESEVPVFVKQMGTYLSKKLSLKDRHGADINEWSEQLRIQEFPKKWESKNYVQLDIVKSVCEICRLPLTKEEKMVGHCFNCGEQDI